MITSSRPEGKYLSLHSSLQASLPDNLRQAFCVSLPLFSPAVLVTLITLHEYRSEYVSTRSRTARSSSIPSCLKVHCGEKQVVEKPPQKRGGLP